MLKYVIKRALKKLKKIIFGNPKRFDSTGERVDIIYNKKIDFETLDMFQKSHFKRYEYALDVIAASDICGDFACGTGYGAIMLSKKAASVIGADLNAEVVAAIQQRYRTSKNVRFITANLLDLSFDSEFDNIISFETIEHFTEENILKLLQVFGKSLKSGGKLVISTPYMQERSEAALKLGHHFTFYIDEKVIINWLSATSFDILSFKYQNYDSHIIEDHLKKKDFLICVAEKR